MRLLGILIIALAPVAQAKGPKYLDKDYKPCGGNSTNISCVYGKTTEIASLSSLKSIERIDKMDQEFQRAGEDKDKLKQFVQDYLPEEYCNPKEDDADCYKRFRFTELMKLPTFKSAIMDAEDMKSKLATDEKLQSGYFPATYTAEEKKKLDDLKAQTPEVPTTTEVGDYYNENRRTFERMARSDFIRFLASKPHKPTQDQFPKYTTTLKDRKGLPPEKVIQLDKSCGKDICVDRAKYLQARNVYNANRTKWDEEYRIMLERIIQETNPIADFVPETIDDQPKEVEAFRESRVTMVNTANQELSRGIESVREIQFGATAGGRAGAGTTEPVVGDWPKERPLKDRNGLNVRLTPDQLDQVIEARLRNQPIP